MTAAVQDLAARVWEQREKRALRRDAVALARATAAAAGQDVRDYPNYDPETDVRLRWLREIAAALRTLPGWGVAKASADVEYGVRMVLGRLEVQVCGKDRASGE